MYSVRDESALKIQAVYRGYSIRKHFLTVRLRFERIVKSIEGNTEVLWHSSSICIPRFKEDFMLSRLKEIEARRGMLVKELESIEISIQQRKQYLRRASE